MCIKLTRHNEEFVQAVFASLTEDQIHSASADWEPDEMTDSGEILTINIQLDSSRLIVIQAAYPDNNRYYAKEVMVEFFYEGECAQRHYANEHLTGKVDEVISRIVLTAKAKGDDKLIKFKNKFLNKS